MERDSKFKTVIEELGYDFKDENLLRLALTHRSCGMPNNERMEFLGDALLGMIISSALFDLLPDTNEGELSRLRSELVSGDNLAELAMELELPQVVKLGAGELKSGGQCRKSILAGTLEALIGAIYLDGGVEPCRDVVMGWFSSHLKEVTVSDIPKDPKTRLQEYLQARGESLPAYKVLRKSGAAHQLQFEVACKVALLPEEATAIASSRREAEKRAAQQALELLEA